MHDDWPSSCHHSVNMNLNGYNYWTHLISRVFDVDISPIRHNASWSARSPSTMDMTNRVNMSRKVKEAMARGATWKILVIIHRPECRHMRNLIGPRSWEESFWRIDSKPASPPSLTWWVFLWYLAIFGTAQISICRPVSKHDSANPVIISLVWRSG
jgi:hypothetical protein